MRTTPVLAAAALMAAGIAMPTTAAPKPKPITKTYTATAPAPDPTNYAQQGYSVCAQNVPQSFHVEPFKAPAPGKLKIDMSAFQGDWDLLVTDGKGAELGNSGATQPADPPTESLTLKVKKKGAEYRIIACNWAGGPTGTVKYTFTYA